MKINREELLRCLSSVSPGLAKREVVEQSSCYCFRNGTVVTYNEEIAVTCACAIKEEFAVPAGPLTSLLQKLTEPEVDVFLKDGELIVGGARKRSGIRVEAQVLLPMESVEMPDDDAWVLLDGHFCEGLDFVSQCTAEKADVFELTCVHIGVDFVEGCDNFQFAHYPVTTGLQSECLLRGKSVRHIIGLGMNAVAESSGWIHFRNSSGLVLSCRRWSEVYPDYSSLRTWTGQATVLPGGLKDAVGKAQVFSGDNATGDNVRVELTPGKLRLRGEGSMGWYEERIEVKYSGPPLRFMIAPRLLADLTAKSQECEVTGERLRIRLGQAQYVACLFPEAAPVHA